MSLTRAGIAHGDIQSNNILVGSDGTLTLVDYDGMFVPRIAKLGAIETGHRNFQHPERTTENPFDANLDRFSFALLHTTIGALAERPGLWSEFASDNDAIILRESDLADPASSRAFTALLSLPISGAFAQRLTAIASAPYASTPSFDDFIAGTNIPTARAGGRSSRSGNSSAGQASVAPWYLDPNAGSGSGSSEAVTVVDASDRAQCLALLGSQTELVGRVEGIKRGGSVGNSYVHLILGTNADGSVRIRLLSPALLAFAAAHRPVDESWVGSWVSGTGVMRNDMSNGITSITLSHADDLTSLTFEQARSRLAPASSAPTPLVSAASSTQVPTSNRERIASLGQKAGTTASASGANAGGGSSKQTITTASASGTNAGGGSSKRKIGELSVGPAIGVFAAVIAVIGLIIAIVVGSSSGSTGSSGAPAAPVIATAPAPEATTASDNVGTCWAETAEDANLLDIVECTASNVDFKATSAVDTSDQCTGEWMTWDDGRFTCLIVWPPVVYQTCIESPNLGEECQTGLSWTYESCWNVGGFVLEQKIQGQWKTVKQDISTKDNCMPDFPWTVWFTRKAAGLGTKQYRLYSPASGEFSATVEPITVTVTEK
jgi:hypothetical protein